MEGCLFAMGFCPWQVLAFSWAHICTSSVTWEVSRRVVILGGFCLCRGKEEKVHASGCGCFVFLFLDCFCCSEVSQEKKALRVETGRQVTVCC